MCIVVAMGQGDPLKLGEYEKENICDCHIDGRSPAD
jgi:hypothetical protein